MIDQFAFVHFNAMKNDHLYMFQAQLGVAYEEAIEALDEIKASLEELKKLGEEQKAKAEAEKVVTEEAKVA